MNEELEVKNEDGAKCDKSDQERLVSCSHLCTQGRKGEIGSWCVDCGVKVYEVEDRECKDCKHYFERLFFTGCDKKMMAVSSGMRVTYKIKEGTCFDGS